MAIYPLLYGNDTTKFDLLDVTGAYRNIESGGGFDVYLYKNASNALTQGFALITLQNTASAGVNAPVTFSEISLVADDGDTRGFSLNPVSQDGTIHIGSNEDASNNTGNKTVTVGAVPLGDDGVDNNNQTSRWLRVTKTGDIADADNDQETSVDLGIASGATDRVIPIYTTAKILEHDLPSHSWATFVLAFFPEDESDGGTTVSLKIAGNTGTTLIPLNGDVATEVNIDIARGSINESGDFVHMADVADGATVDLGAYGTTTGTLSVNNSIVKVYDSSPSPGGFVWHSLRTQAAGTGSFSTYMPTDGSVADSVTSIASTTVKDIAGASVQGKNYSNITNIANGNNGLFHGNGNWSGPFTPDLYRDFTPANFKSGTIANDVDTALNYNVEAFYASQWQAVKYTLQNSQPGDVGYIHYAVKIGVYHRLTLPESQWLRDAAYTQVATSSGDYQGPQLLGAAATDTGGVFQNGDYATLKINLRWNNWAKSSSAPDCGTGTAFNTANNDGFPLVGDKVTSVGVNGVVYAANSADDTSGTVTTTSSFTGFSSPTEDTHDSVFTYSPQANLSFNQHFDFTQGDTDLQQNTTNLFGVIEGSLSPDSNDTVYWNTGGTNPHMATAASNIYKIHYWPKQDALTIYPKSSGGVLFLKDEACPGYPSGTGLLNSEIGEIAVENVDNWYNANGSGELGNTPGDFGTNNSSITHANGTTVSNAYSGDGGKIYSNESSTAVNKSGGATGFNSFVDVRLLESGAATYDTDRVFHNAKKRFIRTNEGNTVNEFTPINKIYHLGTAQTNDNNEFIAHGVFKLGNPGNSLIWLHSIHTENAYMYEIDVQSADNDVQALENWGYKPNTSSSTSNSAVQLQFFTEAYNSSDLYNSSNWVTSKAYYAWHISSSLLTEPAFSGSNPINAYYMDANMDKSVGHCIIPNFGANNGAEVNDNAIYQSTVLNNNWTSPIESTGTHIPGTPFTAESGGNIYVRMVAPSSGTLNDEGEYRMALKVTYMVADYANQKYISSGNAADINYNTHTGQSATENKQVLRLKEATYIFRMTVDVTAELTISDQDSQEVDEDTTIDFGTVNVG